MIKRRFLTLCMLFYALPLLADTETDQAELKPEAAVIAEAQTERLIDADTLQQRFQAGFEFYEKKQYQQAMLSLYSFLDAASEDTLNLAWGEFFLGLSYQKLGLNHASVDAFAHLLGRKPNPQIVSAVLSRFEQIALTGVYDQALMIDYAVVNQDFGFVDVELRDFIQYQQGLYNWRVGLIEWGNENFAQISSTSPYRLWVMLRQAQQQVYLGQIDQALALLERILQQDDLADDLLEEAELTAARLYFEQGRFDLAIALYSRAVDRGNGTSPVLLELAWAHYLSGNGEKALGLLYAFNAPSYRQLFTPEFYVLNAHIYKDVCYYDAAAQVSARFSDRYQRVLDALYQRQDALNPDYAALHQPLLARGSIARYWQFLKQLEQERELIDEALWSPILVAHLQQLYALKIEETQWNLQQALRKSFDQLANKLLMINEEMSLIEYEMGVQRFQDQLDGMADLAGQELEQTGKTSNVAYPFQGEYWNDELDNFVITLRDACEQAQLWEER